MDPPPSEPAADGEAVADSRRGKTGNRLTPPLFQRAVAIPAALVALFFILATLFFTGPVEGFLRGMQGGISSSFGWFYLICINVALLTAVILLFSPARRLRLGGDEAEPEFSTFSWLSMLFSAGMGIGLLYFSVAEPMMHYLNPAFTEPGTAASFHRAMEATYFLWGIHVWAIYAVIALALAYFAFNRGLPLSVRSGLYPFLGERVHGGWGHLVDVIAIVATLFGLATTLGFGAQQVGAGLEHIFGLPSTLGVQIAAIVVITALATLSVVLGLHRGIRNLSVLTMRLSALLLVVVFLVGPTVLILDTFVQSAGGYLQHFLQWATHRGASSEQGAFFSGWSIFYWGWWMSWGPFVGLFIARISRGRTIGEFLLGVILAPTVVTIFWMATFGTSTYELEAAAPGFAQAVGDSVPTALFRMLAEYPLAWLTSGLGLLLVIAFFVTSSDSGSLVVDSMASGGRLRTGISSRVFWASLEGAIAATLLLGGGLSAMQAVSLSAGLPFAVVVLFLCAGLLRTFVFHRPATPPPPLPQRSRANRS